MHRFTAAVSPLLLLAASGHAQAIRLGPYLQDATPTDIWVMWETTAPAVSLVEWGASPDALTHSVTGASIASQGSNRIHQTQITGLAPDTPYYYQVRTPTQTAGPFRFRTPPVQSAEEPFRFVAYSDTQGGPFSNKHTEVINDGVIDFIRDNFGPNIEDELAFSIEPGDLVDNGDVYDQWKAQFFDEEQNLIQHIPIYPVIGNHERNSHWFFDYFKLPENGTPGYLEHWWYKDHGNVRIIGCDSNGAYRIQQQLDWLDGVLADAANDDDIDFVFAQMHHPYQSEPWTPGNTPYTGEIVRRLEAFSTATGKPSIHFFGHTHAYERGQSRDHDHLWVDVSAAEGDLAWWGEYDRQDYAETQKSFMDWGFVLMEVEAGDHPQFRLRRITRGNQYDPRDNDVIDDITVKINNASPDTPAPLQPADGAIDLAADAVMLKATPFNDPDGDIHLESHFQLTTVSGNYTNPIDHWIRFENWFAPPDATGRDNGYYSVNTVTDPDITHVAAGELLGSMTYYWRVRYRDGSLGWSDWSDEFSFTTGEVPLGACCLPNGLCDQLTATQCAAAGGTWLGVDSECDCPTIITLLEESFDAVPLGPPVDEPGSGDVWTTTAPAGWSVDQSNMPAGGVTEWRGWTFADPAFWSAVGGQSRDAFTLATGAVAIADTDEWDDAAHDPGDFNSSLLSPSIDLSRAAPGTVELRFDSSFRPYDQMTGIVAVSFDDGATWDNLLTLNTAAVPGGASSLTRADERIVLPIDNPDTGAMRLRFSLLDGSNDWWWAIDDITVTAQPKAQPHTLLIETFDALPLGPFVSPTEGGGDGTDWTSQLPAGWTRDNGATPTAGPIEFFGFNAFDKGAWIATAGNQARDTFALGTGAVMVADPDEYDDAGDIDPDRFNVLIQTPALPLVGTRANTVSVDFDSSFRPYDDMTGRVEVSFDDGGTWSTLLTLDTPSIPGGTSSLARANERVSLPVANPASGSMIVRFAMTDAGNDWWWAFDNLAIIGECLADLAAPFGSINTNDFFAFLTLYQAHDPLADATGDTTIDTNDFFAFLAAYQAGC